MNSLLPPNATELEKKLEKVTDIKVDSVIDKLWDINNCPEEFLKLLAISLSVDYWDEKWTLERKRSEIKRSVPIHRIKGSKAAIDLAVKDIPADVEIVQWYEKSPKGKPKTFDINIKNHQAEISQQDINETFKKVSLVKPASAHFNLKITHNSGICINTVAIVTAMRFMSLRMESK